MREIMQKLRAANCRPPSCRSVSATLTTANCLVTWQVYCARCTLGVLRASEGAILFLASACHVLELDAPLRHHISQVRRNYR